jgi:hypothetical protein
VARSYVEAYNRRDGKALCAAFARELRDWFQHMPGSRPSLSCPQLAAGRIGYGEEMDTPTFRRLQVLSVRPHLNGRSARVEIKARYHYKAYPKPLTFVATDEIYLVDRHGWHVVKPGGVYFLTQSAYGAPESMLDPPIGDAEAHRPAPQPAASFECNGTTKQVTNDVVGDAPVGLDLRAGRASVNRDATICLRFSFVDPPKPGTSLDMEIDQPTPVQAGTQITAFSVRIGSGGRFHFTAAHQEDASRLFEAGWKDGRLEVRWKHPGRGPFLFKASTKTLQAWEPLIHDPMKGSGGEPFEGRGDGLGAR